MHPSKKHYLPFNEASYNLVTQLKIQFGMLHKLYNDDYYNIKRTPHHAYNIHMKGNRGLKMSTYPSEMLPLPICR